MWYKNLGGMFVRYVTIHVCDRQTDVQTDMFAVAKTALHICSAVKTLDIEAIYGFVHYMETHFTKFFILSLIHI